MRVVILALALWISAPSCFDRRCDMAIPALIDTHYLAPSFMLCTGRRARLDYICHLSWREFGHE